MKIVVDMNMSPMWPELLQANGYDAIHWREVGASDAGDEDIMAWAKRNGAVIFTTDLDFSQMLYASGDARPSVVQFRPGRQNPSTQTRQLLLALSEGADDLNRGALLTIDLGRHRLRLLPLVKRD